MSTRNLSPRLGSYFKDYSSFHKTKGNRITHYFGIPMIIVGLLGILSAFVFGPENIGGLSYLRFDGGILLLILGLCIYLYLDWKISIPFSLVLIGFYFLGRATPAYINWTFFIVGWILQGIGHKFFEKKSPAFFKNFLHLFIGPIWIFSKIIGYE